MSVITIAKEAIAHNMRVGWNCLNSKKPVRVSRSPEDSNPQYCNVVEILDKEGRAVAAVVTSKDGNPIANFGTHVAVYTVHPVRVKA